VIKNKRPYKTLQNFHASGFNFNVDGIKMDIEGAEFELIEQGLLPPSKKLVMEYHFSKDRSFRNFVMRMNILKKRYNNVYYIPSLHTISKYSVINNND